MRGSAFDFVGNLDTLLAVVVGAGLATIGGLIGEHFEDRIARRRKERDAARFFAEIMTSIDTLVGLGVESQKVGDPWGPVSMRLFRSAMRETEIYERNRERLFEIGDPDLRRAIHSHLISEIFPLEALLDYAQEIASIKHRLDDEDAISEVKRQRLLDRIEFLSGYRDNAREFIVAECGKTREICDKLMRFAKDTRKRPAPEPAAGQAGSS